MGKSHSGKRQYGAVVVRPGASGGVEVLLITSRRTGRWVIPKGWPMRGRTLLEAALTEAYEEAGVVGHALAEEPVGRYRYRKLMRSGQEANLWVSVFLVFMDEMLEDWPERAERVLGWFSPSEAAASVAEPTLAKIIRRLPRTLAGIDLTTFPQHQEPC